MIREAFHACVEIELHQNIAHRMHELDSSVVKSYAVLIVLTMKNIDRIAMMVNMARAK